MRLFLLIPIALILSCASMEKLTKEVQEMDDAVVKGIVNEVEDYLELRAREIEDRVINEAVAQSDAIENVDNDFIRKSHERLRPIVEQAIEDIRPVVERALDDIRAQVREEVMEELTGQEINDVCPGCKDTTEKDVEPYESIDKKEVEKEVESVGKGSVESDSSLVDDSDSLAVEETAAKEQER